MISVFISARFGGSKPLRSVSAGSICKARQTHLKFQSGHHRHAETQIPLPFWLPQTDRNEPKLKILDAHPKQGSLETTRSIDKEDFLIKLCTQPPQMLHFRAWGLQGISLWSSRLSKARSASREISKHSRAKWGLGHVWDTGGTQGTQGSCLNCRCAAK